MGNNNNALSLILAKARKQGFFPSVSDEEVAILEKEAVSMLSSDIGQKAVSARSLGSRMAPMSKVIFPKLAAGSPSFPGTVAPTYTNQSGTIWNSANIRYLSGTPVEQVPGTPAAGGLTRTSGSSGNSPTHFAFLYHGSHFSLMVSTYGVTDVQIYINGQPLWATPQTFSANTNQFIDVKLTTQDTYNVRCVIGNGVFIQVLHEALDTVRVPEKRFRVGLDGDSYMDLGIMNIWSGLPYWVADRTGWEVIHFAQGSTGWGAQLDTNDPLKTPYEAPSRLALKALYALDLLVVVGSVNSGNRTPAQIKTSMREYCSGIKAILPDLPIVIVGVEPWNYGSANQTANNTAMREEAALISNVVGFIDWYELKWLTGTGSTAAPNGTGNQDYFVGTDGVHPSPSGNKWLGENLVAALSRIRIPG